MSGVLTPTTKEIAIPFRNMLVSMIVAELDAEPEGNAGQCRNVERSYAGTTNIRTGGTDERVESGMRTLVGIITFTESMAVVFGCIQDLFATLSLTAVVDAWRWYWNRHWS